MVAATLRAACSLRSAMATRAPSRANSSAIPCPKPEAPPVTSATFPCRRISFLPVLLLLDCSWHHAVRPRPAQSCFGHGARPVFARDPARIAQRVEHREYRPIVHLAFVRLMSRRHRCNLHVSNYGQVFLKSLDEVSAHDLRM